MAYTLLGIKAPVLKRTPVDRLQPHIFNQATNQEVELVFSVLSPRSNDFYEGRMETYTFTVEKGDYRLELAAGSNISKFEEMIANAITSKSVDLTKFFIQIRKRQLQFYAFLGVPITILGAFGIIGGFVNGILADQLFNQ